MKTIKTILILMLGIVMLSGCTKTDSSAKIVEKMMNALEKADQTDSYTMKSVPEQEEGVETLSMTWKSGEYFYNMNDVGGAARRTGLTRYNEKSYDYLWGLININTFEVQVVEKRDHGTPYYLWDLYFALRYPMKLNDQNKCVGLKTEFDWKMNEDGSITAVLKENEISSFSARVYEEVKQEIPDLEDWTMNKCEYTFSFDDQGRIETIHQVYDIEMRRTNDQTTFNQQDNQIAVSYDDVPKKLETNTKSVFEEDPKVGDNVKWEEEGIPRAKQTKVHI